ncbi:MAG: YneF family protein [Mycoplasmataceae bacterium]|jgi:uncharacterized protein YneF (UPF0154 family)|nr:YneF family protein [Mycoplasmataceae bacterium]
MSALSWVAIFVPIVLLIVSAVIGYKAGKKKLISHAKSKPYMNRKQIKAIFQAMGVQISESNVNAMERNFTKAMEETK